MRYVTLILLGVFLVGCSTLKPVEMSPEQLQEQVSSGGVVTVGDRVQIVTSDGTRHRFKVENLDQVQISGEGVAVQISEIVALETKEFSGGKTSALVGGTLVWMLIILAAVPAVVVL